MQLGYTDITPVPGVSGGKANGVSVSASASLLINTIQIFGVSQYKLGKLLGMPYPANASAWFRGELRPSPMYLSRIIHLHQLHISGTKFNRVDHIDWDTGQPIEYKMVASKNESKDDLPELGFDLSRKER